MLSDLFAAIRRKPPVQNIGIPLFALALTAGLFLTSGRPLAADAGKVPNQSGSGTAPEQSLVAKTNVLKPGDVILVKVYQEDDLETKAAIDRDGLVTLPLLGSVQVGNKTAAQATAAIHDLYAADYLVNPRVSLALLEHAKLRFTVMGQVQRPGTYEFPDEQSLNLLQGIAMAGGYTRLSAPTKVSVQRLQDGQPVILPLNAEKMSRDKTNKPFEIRPDDIITVGERIF